MIENWWSGPEPTKESASDGKDDKADEQDGTTAGKDEKARDQAGASDGK